MSSTAWRVLLPSFWVKSPLSTTNCRAETIQVEPPPPLKLLLIIHLRLFEISRPTLESSPFWEIATKSTKQEVWFSVGFGLFLSVFYVRSVDYHRFRKSFVGIFCLSLDNRRFLCRYRRSRSQIEVLSVKATNHKNDRTSRTNS